MVLRLILIPVLLFTTSIAHSFVLISGPSKAKLEVSSDFPTIHFIVDSRFPQIYNKHLFLEGIYQNLDDSEFYFRVLETAFSTWSLVSSSYITFTYEIIDDAPIDPEDYSHTIALGSLNSVASAAALPLFEGGIIYDCDISISSRRTSAQALAYTLVHEIGHCLGLGHNHSDPESIMGYKRTNIELTLGADDIAGVTYLYPTEDYKKNKEMISCGTVGAASNPQLLSWLLLTPLALFGLRDLKRKK